jgi:phenylalanyl-tRNA synthetase alpha chain
VKKGPNFSTSIAKPETDLTVDMLTSCVHILSLDAFSIQQPCFSGSWKTSTYKKYNFEADGIPTNGGGLHPLLKVREEIRNIFFEMG